MVRKRDLKRPLFYSSDEIAAASPTGFYARLEVALAGQWETLAAPLAKAFVKDWGRPTDPIVYLKCYLIGYFENITYDTDLAERIADSISLRSFLGYTLTERTPDHSSLSRVRAQLGEHCAIEEVLETVVQRCIEAGLVGGEVAAVDASLLPANAALSSLRSLSTGKPVREHLQEVWARNRVRAEEEKKETLTLSNAEYASATDPEAKTAHKPGQRRGLYYRATHVTDGKHQIILAAECSQADGGEAEAAKAPLTQAHETLQENGLALSVVVADAGYDDADLHAHIEELGGVPLTHLQREGTPKPKGFRKSNFVYLPGQDCYQCPAGKLLAPRKRRRHGFEYWAQVSDCQACAHRQACVGESKAQSRCIRRSAHEASRERTRARVATEEGRALLKCRGRIVEAPFGHMKTYGGLGRVNCRGAAKAQVKVVLAAVAWNLTKLVRALLPPASTLAVAGSSALCGVASSALYTHQRQRANSFWRRVTTVTSWWLHSGLRTGCRLQVLFR